MKAIFCLVFGPRRHQFEFPSPTIYSQFFENLNFPLQIWQTECRGHESEKVELLSKEEERARRRILMILCNIGSSRLRTVCQILCRFWVSQSCTCFTRFSAASKLGVRRVATRHTRSGSSSLWAPATRKGKGHRTVTQSVSLWWMAWLLESQLAQSSGQLEKGQGFKTARSN